MTFAVDMADEYARYQRDKWRDALGSIRALRAVDFGTE